MIKKILALHNKSQVNKYLGLKFFHQNGFPSKNRTTIAGTNTNVTGTVVICKNGSRNLALVFVQIISVFDKVGQMSPRQILPGQLLLWQLFIIKEEPGKLRLKYGQNRMSNTWDIDNIEFLVVVVAHIGGVKSFSCKIQLLLC